MARRSYRPSSCIFLKELPFRLQRKSGNIAKKSSTCTVEITQYALTFPRVPGLGASALRKIPTVQLEEIATFQAYSITPYAKKFYRLLT